MNIRQYLDSTYLQTASQEGISEKEHVDMVKEEILQCTQLGMEHRKTVKWIIEVAALNHQQIIQYAAFIKQLVVSNFKKEFYAAVFVKSSTGFYKTETNLTNGANMPAILMMLQNASPLPVKAAGGIRTYDEAIEMIRLGVKRIGTSGVMAIANNVNATRDY